MRQLSRPDADLVPTPVERAFAEWRAAVNRINAAPRTLSDRQLVVLGRAAATAEIRFRDSPAQTVGDVALKLWALIEQDWGYDPDTDPPEAWQKDMPGSFVLAAYRDAVRLGTCL